MMGPPFAVETRRLLCPTLLQSLAAAFIALTRVALAPRNASFTFPTSAALMRVSL
jgi:hypothetical protein